MGLCVSHDAFNASYSSFNKFRQQLALLVGITLDDMVGFGGFLPWSSLFPDPLHALLNHSDCEGKIEVEDLLPLAERLRELVTRNPDYSGDGCFKTWQEYALDFAVGCELAASNNEPLEFY